MNRYFGRYLAAVLLAWMFTISSEAAELPCGAPTYTPATDRGIFIWRDCTSGDWILRAMGGGAYAFYSGEIASTLSFQSLTPVDLEAHDQLLAPEPTRIQFSLKTWGSSWDGFNLGVPAGASATFSLSTTDIPVFLGPERIRQTVPFQLPHEDLARQAMNIVVIMTDDQRFDTLPWMSNVTERLVSRGVTFTNAYVPTPLCCPSRATMLSGGFLAQNTGVLDNGPPNGGAPLFNDKTNLGKELQAAGYQTLFVGKWMNEYEKQALQGYVPPGWTRFVGRASYATNTSWFSFKYILGSSDQGPGNGSLVTLQNQYTVYYEKDQVLDFLDHAQSDQPFFLFWSPTAPHPPATVAPEDKGSFSDYSYRERGYTESDLSDKPGWVRNNNDPADDDAFVRRQLGSLQSVDRAVAAILDKLTALDRLDDTLIVFTSDNGYMWGEHGLWGKNKAYEESVRVPLVVVMPGIAARSDDHLVSPNLDLGSTLYELAGVPHQTDGMSLVPLLADPTTPWRNEFFFEKTVDGNYSNAIWAGVRNGQWRYIRYWTGEEELYDLLADPYELESRHNDPALSGLKAAFTARTNELLGLAVKPVGSFPPAKVGRNYSFQLTTWGGTAPFTWKLESGQLPQGLSLNAATGVINGVPGTAGTRTFKVRLTDASYATHAERARTFVSAPMKIVVSP